MIHQLKNREFRKLLDQDLDETIDFIELCRG